MRRWEEEQEQEQEQEEAGEGEGRGKNLCKKTMGSSGTWNASVPGRSLIAVIVLR